MGEIELGQYIVERLKQLDVKQVFGLPGETILNAFPLFQGLLISAHRLTIIPFAGDYNLDWLDFIESDKDIQWVGSTNELNASYAADVSALLEEAFHICESTPILNPLVAYYRATLESSTVLVWSSVSKPMMDR
jgi:TPP-dependent 2-oxoacid decarboxylase